MPAAPASTPSRAARAILWGGALAGTGDLTFAFIYYGFRLGVFQTVAGGLMGREAARSGGVPTFLLGILLHYGIATLWSAGFWLASRRQSVLVRHAVPAGLLYGVVVFYGMNCVVLPLSALHTRGWPPPFTAWPLAMHMLVVGLPIALATRRWSR